MDSINMPHPKVNFAGIKHHPYYIFAEDYKQESSGVRVYYHLCHVLNELGYEAYVTSNELIPNFRAPALTAELRRKHKTENRHPIAVYGEIVEGNPLGGDVVVRWVNNRVGNVGVPVEFGSDDLVYYMTKTFAPHLNSENIELLRVQVLDASVFNTEGVDDSKRAGFCYYAHKYFRDYNGVIADKIKNNGISLCQDIPRTHKEIADILRSSEVLYTYEPSTLNGEARQCGCPVVMVRTGYLDNYSYDFNNDNLENQYIISEDEISIESVPQAVKDRVRFQQIKYKKDYDCKLETIARFVEATQAKADGCEGYTQSAESEKIIDFCSKHKNIYIYGAGSIGKNCCNVLKTFGIANVKGFVVSNNFASHDLLGLPIYKLSNLPNASSEGGIILAMRMCYRDEVVPELDAKGYEYFHYYVLSR